MATNTVSKLDQKCGAARRGARSIVDVRQELVVEILPGRHVRWSGTTAQLVTEGLLPKWFSANSPDATWEQDGFEFCLKHTRPDHMTLKEWRASERDYWQLRRSLKYGGLWEIEEPQVPDISHGKKQQQRRARALRDNRFQAFLSLVGAKPTRNSIR
jgi:hypothetical protein